MIIESEATETDGQGSQGNRRSDLKEDKQKIMEVKVWPEITSAFSRLFS